jgi:hypothetical protein
MFFDDHPRFQESSTTAAGSVRLNERHAAIIDANREVLAGARVLDIASHDGRWTCAALAAGARHVTGVEARPELVDNAYANLTAYGFEAETYAFINGDIFDVLNSPAVLEREFDVVMCLGFIYHTLRYQELFGGIRALAPRHLIVDTAVIRHKDRLVRIGFDPVEKQSAAAPSPMAHDNVMLVGRPSMPALKMMLEFYGFQIEGHYDWQSLAPTDRKARKKKNAYDTGRRVTFRCRAE